MNKNRILPVHVGGTIASAESETGFKPKLCFADLLAEIDQGLTGEREIAPAVSPFGLFGIDSAGMRLADIRKIAETISSTYEDHDAFMVTHGTDTLAYTASMLSFMLRGISKPVIVTGAQKTLEDDGSDVAANLETALLAASTSNRGVWVAFNGKIINAVRATKIDIGVESLDAFVSNNRDEIPIAGFLKDNHSVNSGVPESFSTDASEAVDICCLTHTTRPHTLRTYLEASNLRALIVMVYGMSGHREELMEVLSRWSAHSGAVVIAKTHAPYGSTDLSKYELGVKALRLGILSSLDMTLESVYAKTSTLLAHVADRHEFRRRFYENYCDEIDETGVHRFLAKAARWLSVL